MRQSSQTSQIICITHSPQIAAIAAEHLLVSKKETEGRTFSSARVLLHDGRVNEIARIIGGEKIYEQLVDECDVAHITKINFAYDADAYFPNLDEKPEWVITGDSEEQTYFDLEFYFYRYEKRKK